MQTETKNKTLAIIVFAVVVIFIVGIIQLIGFGIDLLRKRFDLDTTPKEQVNEEITNVEEKSSEYPDYDFYQKMNKLNLISSVESRVDKNGKVIGRSYKKFIRSGGGISNAYLFVSASVDNGEPLKVWDSVYISLRKEVNGNLYSPLNGHLLRSKSLNVPKNNTTTLLYDLRRIPFITIPYSDDKKPVYKDWLTLIQNADTFQFETFLSTLRAGGEIMDVSIGYECAEDAPDCRLEILDKP